MRRTPRSTATRSAVTPVNVKAAEPTGRLWTLKLPDCPFDDVRFGSEQTHANAALCTPATARPDGSAASANAASHAIAAGVEHAIDLPPGTVRAQASPGKCCSNR